MVSIVDEFLFFHSLARFRLDLIFRFRVAKHQQIFRFISLSAYKYAVYHFFQLLLLPIYY